MIKKTLYSLLFCLTVSTAFSQTVNNIPVEEIDVTYLEIVGTSRFLSNKLNVEIDFGQNSKFFNNGKETQVKDKDGKNVKFNSMIDAVNFMHSLGYTFVQGYTITLDGQNIYRYMMKKTE